MTNLTNLPSLACLDTFRLQNVMLIGWFSSSFSFAALKAGADGGGGGGGINSWREIIFYTDGGGGGCICIVYIGVGGWMTVRVIAKLSVSLGWGGGGGICIRVYIGMGGMKVCVIAKLAWSESEQEFLYNIFWVSSWEYTSFRVDKCVSIYNVYVYIWSCLWDIDQVKLIISMGTGTNVCMVVCYLQIRFCFLFLFVQLADTC